MKLPIKLPNKVTQFIGKTMLRAKKASPEVCVVSGIICGGAAIVMVGVKTWKKKDTLKKDYDSIKAVSITEKTDENGEKSIEKIPYKELVEDDKKLLWSYRKTFAGDIIKTYWIPTVLGIGSVGLIWGGRTMLRRELSAVTSAYALLMESYKQYRQRVIDDVGIEKDQEYMHGIKMVDAVDEETGEVSKRAIVDREKSISQYARWYNEGEFDPESGVWLWRNGMWKDNPLMNYNNLTCLQNAANDQLRADGYLFLNDVYKMLCIPPSREGQIVGWTLDGGDGYVDFGVFPSKKRPKEKILPVNRLFLDGKSANALLDFNVDGPILGVLDKAFGRDYANKLVEGRNWN